MNTLTRIPTLLGILLVVMLVGGLGFAFERISRGGTSASGSATPTRVEFTNVTEGMFTVSWITQEATTGVVSVESTNAKMTLFDERDVSGKLGKYLTHVATMRTAQSNTEYRITILSNGKKYTSGNEPYRIRTGPAMSSPPPGTLEPAFGIVIGDQNTPAEGAIVYLTPQGGQMLSTLVKSSGSWIIPLNLARTTDLTSYLPVSERIDEDILVRFGTAETTAITDTLNDNPVPDMNVGKTYDFRRQQAKVPATAPSVLGQATGQQTYAFAITTPVVNTAIPTNLPSIQGTGVPGKSVSITIGITNPIGGTTVVGADGIWRFTPPQRLSPGKQSVTATSQGASGQTVAATVLFEILKSGTQVLGDATPSATLAPSLPPGATDTATLAGEPIPTSGSILPTIVLLLMGIALFGGGAALARTR